MTTPHQLRSDLNAYFARSGPRQPLRVSSVPVALIGGWDSSLYTFVVEKVGVGNDTVSRAGPLVLKMYSGDAGGGEHATREWRALNHLRDAGIPVPAVIAFDPDFHYLGYPLIVMEQIAGTSLWQSFEEAGPIARARLTRSFVEQLVALHALDPRLLEPATTLTDPFSSITEELNQLRRDSEASQHAGVVDVVRWLEQRQQMVPCPRPVILHRDYHPWNVLVDAAHTLWVIDWDWRIGDPRFDLAWTCTQMERSGFGSFSSAVREEYGYQSDRNLDGLDYFEVLTTLRWLLNVLPAELGRPSNLAARASFGAFLIDPVRDAQVMLFERTGTRVDVQIEPKLLP